MPNSTEPDQSAPLGAVLSGSVLLAQTHLSHYSAIYDNNSLEDVQEHFLLAGGKSRCLYYSSDS